MVICPSGNPDDWMSPAEYIRIAFRNDVRKDGVCRLHIAGGEGTPRWPDFPDRGFGLLIARKRRSVRKPSWRSSPFSLGYGLGNDGVERALLVSVVLLVLIVELLNTGIENVVDRIGKEPHKLSGRAKDVGSAAVFLVLVLAAAVWLLVLMG